MKRRFLWVCCLPTVLGIVLSAQDASMVLRTSVTYNTQKATLPLSDDQRKEADRLSREAVAQNAAGKYGDALRSLYHGLAVMRKTEWTPELEFASSLQGKLDHAMVEPGAHVMLSLRPLYDSPDAVGLTLKARVVLADAKKTGVEPRTLREGIGIEAASKPFALTLPDVPAGDYAIEVRMGAGDDAAAGPARAAFLKVLPIHIDTLAGPVAHLRARLAKAPRKDGIATAEYAVVLYERADAGEIDPSKVNFREEFANANAVLDSLEAGKNPFAGQHGDSHRAYRSALDNTLQPYRLFVPSSYDGSKPTPLVVALHGMGGDENSIFDAYEHGQLKREAERLGFLVVCPKGRDTASMYRGTAEQDVLDAMKDVERGYTVDASRIYLMGHSMGGFGTWSIAMNHPELFAALGPISGGGAVAGLAKISRIPAYVVHGDDDRTVAVAQSRNMVEAGKKLGMNIVYVEVPGGSHSSVAAPAFAGMLDFFARQHKGTEGQ